MPRRPKALLASKATVSLPAQLQHVNLHAAGIDIGATAHFVAVPPDRSRCVSSAHLPLIFTGSRIG
jgi:hypothetical protein